MTLPKDSPPASRQVRRADERLNKTLEAALRYTARGWRVLPLVPGDKVPLKGTNGVYDATCDADSIRAWWNATPDANVGMAMGNGIVDIEWDAKHDGERSLRHLQMLYGELPPTWCFRSGGGGEHSPYIVPEGVHIVGKQGFGSDLLGRPSGVDVLYTGQYAVMPPSIHPNGKPYVWLNTLPIADLPPDWCAALAGDGATDDVDDVEYLSLVEPGTSLELVRLALEFIHPDIPRPDWIHVVLAMTAQFPTQEGFELFNLWSKGGLAYRGPDWKGATKSKYGGRKATLYTWNNIGRHRAK